MSMSWKELAEQIALFTPEQKAQSVTVYVSGVGEYYGLIGDFPLVESDESCDRLDPGHKYLVI